MDSLQYELWDIEPCEIILVSRACAIVSCKMSCFAKDLYGDSIEPNFNCPIGVKKPTQPCLRAKERQLVASLQSLLSPVA